MSLYSYQKPLLIGSTEDIQAAVVAIQRGNNSLRQKILLGKRELKYPRKRIPILIKKLFTSDDLKESIRLHKLKEAKLLKAELEDRLLQVSDSISSLAVDSSSKPTKSLSPEAFKNYHKQWKRREEEFKFRRLELERQVNQEKIDVGERQKIIETSRKERIQLKLQEMQAKNIERKNRLSLISEQYARITKPLYLKLEDKFQKQFVLPEIERQKTQLAKNHRYFHQIDFGKLKEWTSEYDQKVSRRTPSPSRLISVTEDPLVLQRKELHSRRNRYSNLVKEIYKPAATNRRNRKTHLDSPNIRFNTN